MFSVVPLIATRLSDALGSAWSVADGTQAQDRRPLPRADVRLQGAALDRVSGPGVTLQLRYVVTLCVSRESTAFTQLDQAVSQAIARVHHWRPAGQQARLALQAFAEVEYFDQSLFGYELAFVLTTTHQGSNE